MKEYGVNENYLFDEEDLLARANIPKVSRCLKEIAIIVSIPDGKLANCKTQTDYLPI